MAEYEIKNPIDFRRGGDTVHDLTDKYISETTRIYRFLNDLKTNSINAVEYTEPSAGQIKVADNTIYIRNTDNTEWVELGKVANNFGFLEQVGSKFIGTGDISKEKIAELNSVDLTKALTTDNLGSEAGKIPTLNDAGKLPVNITGDAAKIGGVNINIEAPSDGQSLMYRASTNTWVNENKMAVGGIIPWEARKQYYINDVCLVDTNIYICIYEHESGDEFEQSREIPSEVIGGGTVTVALWKSIGINLDRGVIAEIADEQVAVHNSAVDAHADIRDAVDGKADKTDVAAAVTEAKAYTDAEKAKYLPLSGGKMTGPVGFSGTNREISHDGDDITYGDKAIKSMAFPSKTVIGLSLTFSAGSAIYTAPADGYFVALAKSTAATYAMLEASTSRGIRQRQNVTAAAEYMANTIPVRRGDVITCSVTGTAAFQYANFIYAEGEI